MSEAVFVLKNSVIRQLIYIQTSVHNWQKSNRSLPQPFNHFSGSASERVGWMVCGGSKPFQPSLKNQDQTIFLCTYIIWAQHSTQPKRAHTHTQTHTHHTHTHTHTLTLPYLFIPIPPYTYIYKPGKRRGPLLCLLK